jgi:RNA polymerase primary sigma factor
MVEDIFMAERKIPTEAHYGEMTSAPQAYLRNITGFTLLNKEEEVTLARAIHGDDPEARDEALSRLATSNLRLVIKIANQFLGRGISRHDLISEGNVGLLTAAKKFRPDKGARFSTYSAWWIKQSMRRAIAEQSRTIRIPVQSLEKIHKVMGTISRLSKTLERIPSDKEVGDEVNLSPRTVSRLRHVSLSTYSINELLVEGENNEIGDIIPDPNSPPPDKILCDVELINKLYDLIEEFDERERKILIMRFGLDGEGTMTLEETGLAVGCTRERVRQLQNLAISKLRITMKAKGF